MLTRATALLRTAPLRNTSRYQRMRMRNHSIVATAVATAAPLLTTAFSAVPLLKNVAMARAAALVPATLGLSVAAYRLRPLGVTSPGSISEESSIDSFGTGLSRQEAQELLVRAGCDPTFASLAIDRFFRDVNSTVDRFELELGIIMLSDQAFATLPWTFKCFDTDNDGQLSAEEFSKAIEIIYTIAGRVADDKIGAEEGSLSEMIPVLAEEITCASFSAADIDLDGLITYDEFVVWLESDCQTAVDVRHCFSFLDGSRI